MKDLSLFLKALIFLLPLLVGALLFFIRQIKSKAISRRENEVPVFGGGKLIHWKPSESVVILRDKKVNYISDGDDGGTRWIIPMFGYEFYAKISRAVRDLTWKDNNVLTRESFQAHISIVILWTVADVRKYIFSIKRAAADTPEQRRRKAEEAAEQIIRDVTDSTIRHLVSLVSLGELVSDRPTPYLITEIDKGSKERIMSEKETTLKGTIETQMEKELRNKLANYGIGIERVQIQSIQLAPIVQEAVNEAGIAPLKLFKSKQEARALEYQLAAVAKVLGKDAAALNEFIKNLQGTTLYMMPPFLQRLFGMIDQKTREVEKPESPLELPEFDIEELIDPDGKLVDDEDDYGSKGNGRLK
ncbi:MAG: SPFH domain-containing protein [Calditrichaeota bacterium]|nr:SPFH domain-containing protein [Calditrichota bacterium]